jgi:hypothetical protein
MSTAKITKNLLLVMWSLNSFPATISSGLI